MQYNRKKYEKLISESLLFSLDRDHEAVAFRRESYKMIEYLYCYLLSINEQGYEPYGSEIMGVAARCIHNYDYSKGVFLHYFNAAWKLEYRHILSEKQIEEKYHGLKLTSEEKRCIRHYLKLSEKNKELPADEKYLRISQAMGIPVDKVKYFDYLSNTTVVGDTIHNDDGEETSIFDMIPDKETNRHLDDFDASIELLLRIQEVFEQRQERQKALLSKLLTAKLIGELIENCDLLLAAKGMSFFDNDILFQIRREHRVPSAREIAAHFGLSEQSVSRTYKNFIILL